MTKTLLAMMACVAACDAVNMLHRRVDKNDVQGIRDAVAKGEDVNIIGTAGQTPLMSATLRGHVESVKVLLELGADASIPEKDGYTPIHGAGFQGRAEIVKILVAHGVDPSDRHADGYQPIHRALWGTETRHTDTVKAFIEAGIKWDLTLPDGRTLLDICKKSTNRKTYELLQRYVEEAANAVHNEEL